MPQDLTDIAQQPQNPGGNVNQPASGTYGEQQSLLNLQQSLPAMAPQQQGAPNLPAINPTPMRSTREGAAAPSTVPGIPDVLNHPTQQPNVPASTPLAPTPQLPVTPMQSRMAIVDALAQSPNVSPETREWAQMIRRRLVQASAQ